MMYSETKKIMGTEIEVTLAKDANFQLSKAKESIILVFEIFEKLERKFSRFLPNSELSKLNKNREQKISNEFFKVLKTALKMAKVSKGVFNPLVNLSAIGYSRDFELQEFKPQMKGYNLDFSAIKLDEKNQIVKLPQNAFLDLGGCVKGYAVDCAVKEMQKYFANFIINAGGDLFAHGTFHGNSWLIGVANPEAESEDIFGIELQDKALATSGNYRRKWEINGENFHHLVSGENNKNTSFKNSSVSVIADSAIMADILATIAFLLGEKKGQIFLEECNTFGFYT